MIKTIRERLDYIEKRMPLEEEERTLIELQMLEMVEDFNKGSVKNLPTSDAVKSLANLKEGDTITIARVEKGKFELNLD